MLFPQSEMTKDAFYDVGTKMRLMDFISWAYRGQESGSTSQIFSMSSLQVLEATRRGLMTPNVKEHKGMFRVSYSRFGFLCLMKVPLRYSSKAILNSSCVFITMGPYQATGSPMGLPETSRNRSGSSLALMSMTSPSS